MATTTEPSTTDREPLLGIASITRMAFSGADLAAIGDRLINRVRSNPRDAEALMDLSTILLSKNLEAALAAQAAALRTQQIYRFAPKSDRTGVRLLALMAPGDPTANTPLDFLLEGSDIALTTLYVGPGLPLPATVPDHDVLFVGIGESDASRATLEALATILDSWPRPVLNLPRRILHMSREAACALLHGAPGIEMPLSARVTRDTVERIASRALPITAALDDGAFPIILRPVDSHMGRGLTRLDSPEALTAHLAAAPESEFYISRFVDYAGADGQFRKYRVVLVDGAAFASHLAISTNWVVHYQKAGMEDSADKRAEEERFMVRFDEEFAHRHAAALAAIAGRCGLDYIGIDCAETPDGRLLVFEVDNAVLVHAMDPVDLYPYKPAHMRKVFSAFRRLLSKAIAAE